METMYDVYADLKGMIIDAITRSMDDEDDFDLVMAIGEKIAEIQKIHRDLEYSRDFYKDQVKKTIEIRKLNDELKKKLEEVEKALGKED